MLPPRCSQPPCMNMALITVAALAMGSELKRTGTKAHLSMKASPELSSKRKTATLRTIRKLRTTGNRLPALYSSPIVNIVPPLAWHDRDSCPDYIQTLADAPIKYTSPEASAALR